MIDTSNVSLILRISVCAVQFYWCVPVETPGVRRGYQVAGDVIE